MFKFFLFFLLFLLIFLIFCPLKLKFKIILCEEDLQVFFYKYNIFSLSKIIKKKKAKSSDDFCDKSYNETKKDTKVRKRKKSKNFNFKKLLNILYYNSFKPSLKFSLDMCYSMEDSALTAISYGLIHQVSSFLYLIFDSFFILKKYYKKIIPKFDGTNYLFFEIESIITISFAQIIYIGLLYLLPQRNG